MRWAETKNTAVLLLECVSATLMQSWSQIWSAAHRASCVRTLHCCAGVQRRSAAGCTGSALTTRTGNRISCAHLRASYVRMQRHCLTVMLTRAVTQLECVWATRAGRLSPTSSVRTLLNGPSRTRCAVCTARSRLRVDDVAVGDARGAEPRALGHARHGRVAALLVVVVGAPG